MIKDKKVVAAANNERWKEREVRPAPPVGWRERKRNDRPSRNPSHQVLAFNVETGLNELVERKEFLKSLAQCMLVLLTVGGVILYYNIQITVPSTNSSESGPVALAQYSINSVPASSESRVLHCPLGNRSVTCHLDPAGLTDVGGYLFIREGLIPPFPERKGKIWGFAFDESPYAAPVVIYDKFWRLLNVTSTFNRHSDVPLTFMDLQCLTNLTSTEFFVPTVGKNYYLKSSKLAPVMYMQSNCNTWTRRDEYVKELMKYIDVDSYGKCLNNKRLPENLNFGETEWFHPYDPNLMQIVSRYKFTLAIENAVCHDYVTEKLWRPLIAGSVPLYLGSPEIMSLLPHDRAALLLTDFPSPEDLARHLHRLLNNDSLYDQHLIHKTKQIISNPVLPDLFYKLKFLGVNERSLKSESILCMMCSLLHAPGPVPRQASHRHCDCHPPVRALTMTTDPTSPWLTDIDTSGVIVNFILNKTSAMDILPKLIKLKPRIV